MRFTSITRGTPLAASESGAALGSTSAQKASFWESGDQAKSMTPPGSRVSWRASPPRAPISHTCRFPGVGSAPSGDSRKKARVLPSGENRGKESFSPWVNSTPSLPSTLPSLAGKSSIMMRERLSIRSASTQERL